MIKKLTLTSIAAIALVSGAIAGQTIVYPTEKDAVFSIVTPDGWELEQAEEADGYMAVSGPTGATLYFRAKETTIEKLVEEADEYLGEDFKDVKLEAAEVKEFDGKKALIAGGTGKDEEGTEYGFMVIGVELGGGKILDVWIEAEAKDEAGAKEAFKILESLDVKK